MIGGPTLATLFGYNYDLVMQLTVGDSLAYIHFHEAQHVGQILALAPLMGAASVWLSE